LENAVTRGREVQSLLTVDRVTIKRGSRVVIDELSLAIDAGEIVGLVGANGCGKSTLLTCIAGVLAPHDGRIEIVLTSNDPRRASNAREGTARDGDARDGTARDGDARDGNMRANVWGSSKQRALARRAMGYVPEGADPPGFLRAEELWALCASSRGVKPPRFAAGSDAADAFVVALGLDEVASLTLDKMSLGQRRRACLGAAFLGPPTLLVLDEPDNGLDVKRLAALVDLIKTHAANGGATILASHDAAWLDQLDARRVAM
jgi:ABC-type multidrug transport system ATPase subunit